MGDPLRPAALLDFAPALDAVEHRDALTRIRSYIAAGDCYQVNFTFPFMASVSVTPLAFMPALRQAQPVANGGLIVTSQTCILSLSPELFVERHAGFSVPA
ncbi:MAG: chorismate-binding protein [Betaproteobacteria bacterium]|uniref:Chorismate-binding protein n=1 Tax=Candidatus Proximibacter danicus TaxID=2954365 RepID=A0A9D7K1P9_9PROT|nr:chorismate-binding protein [Candidatus Proximibacter danicus]